MRRFGLISTGRSDAGQISRIRRELIAAGALVAQVLDLDSSTRPYHDIPARCERWLDANWKNSPDAIVILGDRIEALAAAFVATWRRVPLVHIHGGEATFGAFDNQIRDALTKLSHLHFVAAPAFRDRLIQMGEDPSTVYVVGAPGLDIVAEFGSQPRVVLQRFMVTYHPVTLGRSNVRALLNALDRPAFRAYTQVWTGVNADPGRGTVLRETEGRPYVELRDGQYVQMCRHSALVIGNSSSGVIEAPTLEVPSVDIGVRQEGRLRGPSVFHANETVDEIVAAMQAALAYTGPFTNPYGTPGASAAIASVLVGLPAIGLVKRFSYGVPPQITLSAVGNA